MHYIQAINVPLLLEYSTSGNVFSAILFPFFRRKRKKKAPPGGGRGKTAHRTKKLSPEEEAYRL